MRPHLFALALVVPCLAVATARGADDGSKPPTPAATAAPSGITESTATFTTQGKRISVERFEPEAPGRFPAVVVLHGSAGMALGGPLYRETARRLARSGYVAHVVHYFDLTGTRLADLATMKANFAGWLAVVADAVTAVSKQPNVDPKRVGVVGFSLGGFLATALGAFDERVSAVVDYFGGVPEPLLSEIKGLPPVLILHGDADRVVPVREAEVLERVCREKNVPYEVKVYAGQGHFFLGDAARDSADRTLRFLDRHVKQSPTRHEVARPRLDALPPGVKTPAEAAAGG